MRSGMALNDIIILRWTCRMRSMYSSTTSITPQVQVRVRVRVQERDYSSLSLSLTTWSYFVNTDGAVLSRFFNRTIMLDMKGMNGIIRVDLSPNKQNHIIIDRRKPQAERTYKGHRAPETDT